MTLVQNRGIRTYEISIGTIRPLGVIDVPKDKLEGVLREGNGELIVLEVAQAEEEPNLEELKKQADELGIQYAKNIGAKALLKKIEIAKEAK